MPTNLSLSTEQKRVANRLLGPTLEGRVLRYVRKRGLLQAGDTVVVGVSGGPDSTALFLLLAHLAPKLGVMLGAAHFDHRLRGERAARRERNFVTELARSLGVRLTTGAGDVRGHARQKRIPLEEAAREKRYAFLAEAARKNKAGIVAVGHTADDQVETVLMHLLRGSGLIGLAGMLPLSPWPVKTQEAAGLSLARPLLEVTRDEAQAYCWEAGLEPLEDPTNRSLAYRRNRLRHHLLPLLRQYNPRLDQALLRLAAAVAADRRVLEQVATDALADVGRIAGGTARLSRQRLRTLPDGLRLHVLRLAAGQLLGDLQDMSARHLEAIAGAVDKPVGSQLDLPRRLRLTVEYDDLLLSLQPQETEILALPDGEVPLAVPGRTRVGPWSFQARVFRRPPRQPTSHSETEAYLDIDAVGKDLRVRRRRRGDRLRPLGMAGEKKLQDLLVDAKVPRSQRDAVPLVCDGRGIVWVVGHRIAHRARVGASTRRVLHLRAQRHQ